MDQVIASPYHGTLPWFGFIAALAFLIGGVVDGLRAFIKGYRKKLPKPEESIPSDSQNSEDWDGLCFRAKKVIEEIIAELPEEILSEARQVLTCSRNMRKMNAKGIGCWVRIITLCLAENPNTKALSSCT